MRGSDLLERHSPGQTESPSWKLETTGPDSWGEVLSPSHACLRVQVKRILAWSYRRLRAPLLLRKWAEFATWWLQRVLQASLSPAWTAHAYGEVGPFTLASLSPFSS